MLQAIVEEYIASAEPVGSRTISRRHVTEASPATIRNDMSDLEELGLLEQPHTSAGRVPSDLGYRFYVDQIVHENPVPEELANLIVRVLGSKVQQVEGLLQATVNVLSHTSSLISIVLGPQVAPASLSRIEIVSAAPGRALLILIADSGFVETKLVDLPESVDPSNLRMVTELVNDLLRGKTWNGLTSPSTLRELKTSLRGYEAMLDDTIEFLRSSLEPVASERVYISGVARLLDLPEFRDLERAKTVLGVLDREHLVSGMLLQHLSDGVVVTIGRENKQQEMADCSLLSAPYHVGAQAAGRVAVLGPKRMDYKVLLALVELVASGLDDAFGRLA